MSDSESGSGEEDEGFAPPLPGGGWNPSPHMLAEMFDASDDEIHSFGTIEDVAGDQGDELPPSGRVFGTGSSLFPNGSASWDVSKPLADLNFGKFARTGPGVHAWATTRAELTIYQQGQEVGLFAADEGEHDDDYVFDSARSRRRRMLVCKAATVAGAV